MIIHNGSWYHSMKMCSQYVFLSNLTLQQTLWTDTQSQYKVGDKMMMVCMVSSLLKLIWQFGRSPFATANIEILMILEYHTTSPTWLLTQCFVRTVIWIQMWAHAMVIAEAQPWSGDHTQHTVDKVDIIFFFSFILDLMMTWRTYLLAWLVVTL